jgi:hypothetical protein
MAHLQGGMCEKSQGLLDGLRIETSEERVTVMGKKKAVQHKEYAVVEKAYLDDLQQKAADLEEIVSNLCMTDYVEMRKLSKEEQKRRSSITDDEYFYEGRFDDDGFPTFEEPFPEAKK